MDSEFKIISAEEAKKMIEKSAASVIDIRQKEDFEEAHIQGASWVGQENIDEFLKKSDKSVPLICYCYHGISSQQAAGFLKSSGFQDVYSLEGGFEHWRMIYSASE